MITFPLDVLLYDLWGIEGVALATTLTLLALQNIVQVVYLRRVAGFTPLADLRATFAEGRTTIRRALGRGGQDRPAVVTPRSVNRRSLCGAKYSTPGGTASVLSIPSWGPTLRSHLHGGRRRDPEELERGRSRVGPGGRPTRRPGRDPGGTAPTSARAVPRSDPERDSRVVGPGSRRGLVPRRVVGVVPRPLVGVQCPLDRTVLVPESAHVVVARHRALDGVAQDHQQARVGHRGSHPTGHSGMQQVVGRRLARRHRLPTCRLVRSSSLRVGKCARYQ